jgi:hypothetical protein
MSNYNASEQFRKWWASKPDSYKRAKDRKWRRNNPEGLRKIKRRWYEKHREKILLYEKQRYAKNRDRIIGVVARRCRLGKKRIRKILVESGCIRCGERDPLVLDFHHREPTKRIARISSLKGASGKIFNTELGKCDVLCANCHYLVEAKTFSDGLQLRATRRGRTVKVGRVREQLRLVKQSVGCDVCGESNPDCLHFHHRDSRMKRTNVACMVNMRLEEVIKEVFKCNVLCANCHRREHGEKRSRLSKKAMHLRWHMRKGVHKAGCKWCKNRDE